MGGGIGILSDLAGNDHYTAGILLKLRYWFAVGILHDKVGDDKYESYFFAIRTAHGYHRLLDEAGNDLQCPSSYFDRRSHDISISWHIDVEETINQCWYEESQDPDTGEMKSKNFGNLIGSRQWNGFAVNVGGDDIYEVLDLNRGRDSLGYTNYVVDPKAWSIRSVLPAVGILLTLVATTLFQISAKTTPHGNRNPNNILP